MSLIYIGIDNGILLQNSHPPSILKDEKRPARNQRLREKNVHMSFVPKILSGYKQAKDRSKTQRAALLFARVLLQIHKRISQWQLQWRQQLQRMRNSHAWSTASLLLNKLLGRITKKTQNSQCATSTPHSKYEARNTVVSETRCEKMPPVDISNRIQRFRTSPALRIIVPTRNVMGQLRQALAHRPHQTSRVFQLHKARRFRFQTLLEFAQPPATNSDRQSQERISI